MGESTHPAVGFPSQPQTHRHADVLHARREGEGAQQVPGDVGPGRVVAEGVTVIATTPPVTSALAAPVTASASRPVVVERPPVAAPAPSLPFKSAGAEEGGCQGSKLGPACRAAGVSLW